MKGDLHVRFCENVRVKFLCVTQLTASGGQRSGTMTAKYKYKNKNCKNRND